MKKHSGFIGNTLVRQEHLVRFLERTIAETKILIAQKEIERNAAKVGTRERNVLVDEWLTLMEEKINATMLLHSIKYAERTESFSLSFGDLGKSLGYISMN